MGISKGTEKRIWTLSDGTDQAVMKDMQELVTAKTNIGRFLYCKL